MAQLDRISRSKEASELPGEKHVEEETEEVKRPFEPLASSAALLLEAREREVAGLRAEQALYTLLDKAMSGEKVSFAKFSLDSSGRSAVHTTTGLGIEISPEDPEGKEFTLVGAGSGHELNHFGTGYPSSPTGNTLVGKSFVVDRRDMQSPVLHPEGHVLLMAADETGQEVLCAISDQPISASVAKELSSNIQ